MVLSAWQTEIHFLLIIHRVACLCHWCLTNSKGQLHAEQARSLGGSATKFCCVQKNMFETYNKTKILPLNSGGFKVRGARGKTTKGGPLMTSSYSANRDKHFWSSLRYGHRRICSWDYGMTDIAEGENAKGVHDTQLWKHWKVGRQGWQHIKVGQ